jgi:hypothetical protein
MENVEVLINMRRVSRAARYSSAFAVDGALKLLVRVQKVRQIGGRKANKAQALRSCSRRSMVGMVDRKLYQQLPSFEHASYDVTTSSTKKN